MKSNNFKTQIKGVIFILMLTGISWFTLSCVNTETRQKKTFTENELQKPLLEANKKVVKTERRQIDDFIARYKWNLTETGTGLRYSIYEHGTGQKAVEGKIAVLEYEVSLLDGEIIYSSGQSGLKEFRIGKGGVESGLEEGILLMKVGDRAKFIIPSHLAFGLLGDNNKISSKTTLVYDVKLLKLK